jgi:hypothetical protein
MGRGCRRPGGYRQQMIVRYLLMRSLTIIDLDPPFGGAAPITSKFQLGNHNAAVQSKIVF